MSGGIHFHYQNVIHTIMASSETAGLAIRDPTLSLEFRRRKRPTAPVSDTPNASMAYFPPVSAVAAPPSKACAHTRTGWPCIHRLHRPRVWHDKQWTILPDDHRGAKDCQECRGTQRVRPEPFSVYQARQSGVIGLIKRTCVTWQALSLRDGQVSIRCTPLVLGALFQGQSLPHLSGVPLFSFLNPN